MAIKMDNYNYIEEESKEQQITDGDNVCIKVLV